MKDNPMNDENDSALDRAVGAILRSPVSEGPPESVRRLVRGLGAGEAPATVLKGQDSSGAIDGDRITRRSSRHSEWWPVFAAAALLLVAFNGGWLLWIHQATPVGWVYLGSHDEWVQLFDNSKMVRGTRPEISRSRG